MMQFYEWGVLGWDELWREPDCQQQNSITMHCNILYSITIYITKQKEYYNKKYYSTTLLYILLPYISIPHTVIDYTVLSYTVNNLTLLHNAIKTMQYYLRHYFTIL